MRAMFLPKKKVMFFFPPEKPQMSAGGWWGGNGQNWQVSAPHSPKVVFLFLIDVLDSAGRLQSYFKKKKKEADSKTKFRFEEK